MMCANRLARSAMIACQLPSDDQEDFMVHLSLVAEHRRVRV